LLWLFYCINLIPKLIWINPEIILNRPNSTAYNQKFDTTILLSKFIYALNWRGTHSLHSCLC